MGKNDDIKPEFEIERIRQITDDEYPDLMIATEIESQQALEHLASKGLKDKYKSYLIEGNDSRGIDIGFLVKVDLPFFIEQQTHKDMLWPLDGRQVRIFSRDVPALLLSKSKGEKPFLIVLGNHAKSKRDGDGDPLSNKLRTAQYEAMAKIITEYQKQFPNTPIVLGGDFNTQVNTAREVQPILPLVKSGFLLADESPVAGRQITPPAERITHTYHPGSGLPAVKQQLDDIKITPGTVKVLEARVVRYKDQYGNLMPIPDTYDQRSKQPSDHFPVTVTISTEGLW
jgi:hypothetical protein